MSDPVLGSLELAELRALSDASLPHAARVLNATITRQPGGVAVEQYPDPTTVTPAACRLQRATQATIARLRADQIQERQVSIVAFSLLDFDESDFTPATRILVSGETVGTPWSKLFDVIGVEPHHSYQTHWRVVCVPSNASLDPTPLGIALFGVARFGEGVFL